MKIFTFVLLVAVSNGCGGGSKDSATGSDAKKAQAAAQPMNPENPESMEAPKAPSSPVGGVKDPAPVAKPKETTARMALGASHACFLDAKGAVHCMGDNQYGQLGDGTRKASMVPVAVRGLPAEVVALAAGTEHTCALARDQTVWCWGRQAHEEPNSDGSMTFNMGGALCDGTQKDQKTPVQVKSGDDHFLAVSAGDQQTCLVAADGVVKCCGPDGRFQLGQGDGGGFSARPSTVNHKTLRATSVVSGEYNSCVLGKDGLVVCWGENNRGQLGNRKVSIARAPDQAVAGLADVVALTAGRHHFCARAKDGSAWCWGDNRKGQAGGGKEKKVREPVQIAALGADVKDLAAGGEHSCAVKADGSVWCWGANGQGQLGDGTKEDRSEPVRVAGLEGALRVFAGPKQTCVVKADGAAWCWGANGQGQLGDGTKEDRPGPVQVRLP